MLPTYLFAWAGAASSMPMATPPPGRVSCMLGTQNWTQADMRHGFELDVLPDARYRITGGEQGDEAGGALQVSPWAEPAGSIDTLFDQGAAVMLRGDDGQPLLRGLFGRKDGRATWLLQFATRKDVYVRCGDELVAATPPGIGVNKSERGIDQPRPPVRLPAGSMIGGKFDPGRYECVVAMSGGSADGARRYTWTYDFHADGSWKRPPSKDTGYYDTRSATGRFDANARHLTNNPYRPDQEFSVFYRTRDGVPRIYGGDGIASASEMQCRRIGPTAGESPKEAEARVRLEAEASAQRRAADITERRRRNLNPPAPGSKRWTGLFAHEAVKYTQTLDPGPLGGSAHLVQNVRSDWEFLGFQANGFVYAGLRASDSPCDKPTVDDHGHALCTTYSVDGGRLRVGHDDRGSVARRDGNIVVGSKEFSAVPPLTPQRLAGVYEAASCHGALCNRMSWIFGVDGSFAAYGLSQAFGAGAGAAGMPMPRGWANTQAIEGRYRVKGQLLEITDKHGQTGTLSILLYPPKDQTLRVNGREFLRKKR
jgi:hypothetical protein